MNFSEIFNQYMKELDCTAKYLSDKTGISMTQISRYRNGMATPTVKGEIIRKIARTFGELAKEKNISALTEETIYDSLFQSIEDEFDYDALCTNLNILIDAMGINLSALGSYCNYNPSGFSKVRLGKRRPRDPSYMVQNISKYMMQEYKNPTDKRKILDLMGREEALLDNPDGYHDALVDWLSGKRDKDAEILRSFVNKMDAFDLDEFLRAKQIGKVHIPVVPLQLPVTKNYKGIDGMEKAIVSFLKATALSRSTRDVIIYSDHPVDHCTNGDAFVQQWMRGIAAMLIKGIRINMIHDVNRPFEEMMIGLEAWIPMYMTGLVSPYYLPRTDSGFHHLIMVSGNSAVTGDAIKGYPDSGRYTFSKANNDVVNCRVRAEQLLSCAKPLVDIYRSDRAEEYMRFVSEDVYNSGAIKSILTSPPIYTISDGLLERVLAHNSIEQPHADKIRAYVKQYRKRIAEFLQKGSLDQSISLFTEDEFKAYPTTLSLSHMFAEADVEYTYEEYVEHIEETKAFAAKYKNYLFNTERTADFRNIQITVLNNETAIASKSKAPTVHFVTRHPQVVHAISNMVMVLTD